MGKKIIGKEILERRQFQATALQPVLQQAAENVAEAIEHVGEAEIEQIYFFLTSNEAECAAKAFIHFCRDRAWVFTNVGTNKHNEELYKFTHRTFLEYFTAAYLNRIHRTPDKLFEVLLPRIAKQEWNVVCQLAFQIQYTKFEDAGDELLYFLLQEIDKSEGDKQWSLLLFAVQCLEFIVPSSRIVSDIIYATLEVFVDFGKSQIKSGKLYAEASTPLKLSTDIIESLHKSTDENYKSIVSSLESYRDKKINNLARDRCASFLEFFCYLKQPIISENYKEIFFIGYEHIIQNIAKGDLFTCILYREEYDISLLDIIEWHGKNSIFYDYNYRIKLGGGYLSIVSGLFLYLCYEFPDLKYNIRVINEASQLGKILLASEFPIVNHKQYNFSTSTSFSSNNVEFIFDNITIHKNGYEVFRNLIANNYDALFGGYIIFATYLETGNYYSMEDDDDWLYEQIKFTEIPFFQFVRYIFIARFRELGRYDREIETELNKCHFNREQRDFIWKWVRREIDLVALPESEL